MRLMSDGLSSKVNSSMAIFLLKANHRMIETEKVQHVGDETEPMTIIFTDSATWRRAKENRKRLEESSGIKDPAKSQVPPQQTPEAVDGYEWTDFTKSQQAIDNQHQSLI